MYHPELLRGTVRVKCDSHTFLSSKFELFTATILNLLRNTTRISTSEFAKSYCQRSPSLSASSTNTNRAHRVIDLFAGRRIITPRTTVVINESLDLLVLYWEIFLLNLVENLQPESSLINDKVKHVKLLLKLSFVDFMAILIIPFGTMLYH